MRHRKKTVKLGRTSAHRNELLANLVCALIDNKRIKTTAPKAKAARSLAEKMVTLGKKGTLAARRQAIATLKNEKSVKELFEAVAPTFESRNGGYTRIIKLGRRISDSSEMVILEWVDAVASAAPAVEEAPVAEETAAAE
ncbi:50S ribosomal protein L17 [Pontiella sp.]|uniref:50S ribosomal protein L17 n=1 Tax=Pontiella sp. TaxID=2837462 RepID=UPI003563153C